jgi:hypothetical protein
VFCLRRFKGSADIMEPGDKLFTSSKGSCVLFNCSQLKDLESTEGRPWKLHLGTVRTEGPQPNCTPACSAAETSHAVSGFGNLFNHTARGICSVCVSIMYEGGDLY